MPQATITARVDERDKASFSHVQNSSNPNNVFKTCLLFYHCVYTLLMCNT